MRIIASMLAALALTTASARDTNRYDRVETRGGIEFSQRGGLGNSNEVVTAFDRAAFWEAAKTEPGFSNAVDAVTEDVDPASIADGSFRIDADRSVYVLATNEIPAVLSKRYETYWKCVGRLASTNDLDDLVADWARKPNGNPDTRVPGIVSNVVTSTWLPKLLMTSGDVWDGESGVRTDTVLFPNSLLVTDTWALSRDVHHSTSQCVVRVELPLYIRHNEYSYYYGTCDGTVWKKTPGSLTWAWDRALSESLGTFSNSAKTRYCTDGKELCGTVLWNGSSWVATHVASTWWQGGSSQKPPSQNLTLGTGQVGLDAALVQWSSGSDVTLGFGSTYRPNVQTVYEQSLWKFVATDPGSGEYRDVSVQIPYDWYDNETRTLVSSVTNDLSAAKIPEDYEEIASKARAAVPNTTTVAGKPLSSNVTLGTLTIQGQTYDGTANKTIDIDGMDYEAMTNTVNAVKNLHWDEGLSVTWTNAVHNGHVYYITVTNTNVSTL